MANIDKFIPILIKNEARVTLKDNEALESLFSRARSGGYSNDTADSGGATMIGVTLKTYTAYCKKNGLGTPNVAKLKAIPFTHWKEILKESYWDKCRADEITSQSVANIFVDWAYNAGTNGIKGVQACVNVIADGIVGAATISAINKRNSLDLFNAIKIARYDYYDEIVRKKPSQSKFKNGWYNRVNSFSYSD